MKFPRQKTKIVCTIGPASEKEEILKKMLQKGMNIARINLAHGDKETHRRTIKVLRKAAQSVGRDLTILADLPGPKLRIGRLEKEPTQLEKGQRLTLTTRKILGTREIIPIEFSRLPQVVAPGKIIYLNDGFVQLRVEKILGEEVICQVLVGGCLRSHKGLNIPGADLGIRAVTSKDLELLSFVLKEGVEAISVSFVETGEDITLIRSHALNLGYRPFIIAKIERAQAVRNIDSILTVSDGIMVARGDLGVEIPIEEIAIVQKKLIYRAQKAAKPVITATQMLESMTENSRPTRAEVTDVTNAIFDGTDCLMLSEETATGVYPVETVEMMARIARSAEAELKRLSAWWGDFESLPRKKTSVEEVIALNIYLTVDRLPTRLVITPTESGATARRVARFRLPVWIVAFSPSLATCRHLQFSYGVFAVHVAKRPPDWRPYAQAWCRQNGPRKGYAVIVQGPSPDHPRAPYRLELLDLGKEGSDLQL
ncbi:pyruvate kinase [Thermosulfuriphilus sp.]